MEVEDNKGTRLSRRKVDSFCSDRREHHFCAGGNSDPVNARERGGAPWKRGRKKHSFTEKEKRKASQGPTFVTIKNGGLTPSPGNHFNRFWGVNNPVLDGVKRERRKQFRVLATC